MTITYKDTEKTLLDEINLDASKVILEKFSTLVRESSSEDERTAFSHLISFLETWGVPHKVHHPELYLSVPVHAGVKVTSPTVKEIRAKTPAFAVSTGDQWVSGELVYVPSGHAADMQEVFHSQVSVDSSDLKGKVVITEGLAMPGKVASFDKLGVLGAIFVNPGKNIHDGICTTIWGAPDLDTIDHEPKIPALAVNRADGDELIELCKQGNVQVEFQTVHKKGWFACPLIDIFIEGSEEPEKYVLLHGHLDSWHVGIGDNTTGDAAMLEMARVFFKHRDKLKRSLRIAIWPGHSTGRYAGSTWFADTYGLDLDANCVAQVNCDSPGCRWATSYDYSEWMSEVDELCQGAIMDTVQQGSKGSRPSRAGDYSFNNIGITSFYMLSSSMPEELLKEKGYYPVGGCGANIEWHTEEDLLHVADLDILLKDIKIYTASILRVVNASVLPYNFRNTVDEFMETIQSYQEAAGNHFSFETALAEAQNLRAELDSYYQAIEWLENAEVTDPQVRKANEQLQELGRTLITINFSRRGKFRHDPALDVPKLPDIAPAMTLNTLTPDSHLYNVTINHLRRGQNRVAWALKEAKRIILS
ncbi:M28 family peptidase [Brevibacillus reuszeri]|uniref:M28 family peptidase n=1 Tax=Brevibacillus reuszeri TaxID=54915 RepID=UPI00289C057E|nr:M28 family peptidase [Brevibacillus reuszeri]